MMKVFFSYLTHVQIAALNSADGYWDMNENTRAYANLHMPADDPQETKERFYAALKAGLYRRVACAPDFRSEDVERAYMATQNIHRSWVEVGKEEGWWFQNNPDCEHSGHDGKRSMMVGDVVTFSDQPGMAFVCASVGFTGIVIPEEFKQILV